MKKAKNDAVRSSKEIKTLLKNLDPNKFNIKHLDRKRSLEHFRSYVTSKHPPEFHESDYSFLLLGSDSAAALTDEKVCSKSYGLLKAAGCPSKDDDHILKRSARPAISLLEYLCFEFETKKKHKLFSTSKEKDPILGDLNRFAKTFCSLTKQQLRVIRFDIHIGKEWLSRRGSKRDACHLLTLILARHTAPDGETLQPLALEDFIADEETQKAYEHWLTANASIEVINAVSENNYKSKLLAEESESVDNFLELPSSFMRAAVACASGLVEGEADQTKCTHCGENCNKGCSFYKKEGANGESDEEGGTDIKSSSSYFDNCCGIGM